MSCVHSEKSSTHRSLSTTKLPVSIHDEVGDNHQFVTLTEESSQTNVILQYKLLVAILSAVCSVIQQP